MPHDTVFGFNTIKRYNMLFLTLSCEEIPANKGAIARRGFHVTLITHKAGITMSIHMKMTMSLIKKTMSKSIIKIYKYTKSNMPSDLLNACINWLRRPMI